MSILITNARVLTLSGSPGARRGPDASALGVVDADVWTEGDLIAGVGDAPPGMEFGATLDAGGRVLMPAFVDAHTHACWAGDRLDEWELKQRGAGYLEILESGGGIMSTVRAVRTASTDELVGRLARRLGWMLREGTATAEIKSGYGLSTQDELKMLEAIHRAGDAWPGTVAATACIGHAIDPDVRRFVDRTIDETLPAIHEAFPGIAVDAYCEQGAWSLDDSLRLFDRAHELGHPCRVHADQFNSLGMISAAIERGFLSVDHLEATTPEQLASLAASDTFGVMLPCSGFHVDQRYANGRAFVDAGGKLVVSTNCNPGSSPTSSIPFAIALATRHLGLTAAEAIVGVTVNAADLLGLHDRGRLEPGLRADLVLLREHDERQLGYEFAGNPVDAVVVAGGLVAADHLGSGGGVAC